jgi:hypothetical protein
MPAGKCFSAPSRHRDVLQVSWNYENVESYAVKRRVPEVGCRSALSLRNSVGRSLERSRSGTRRVRHWPRDRQPVRLAPATAGAAGHSAAQSLQYSACQPFPKAIQVSVRSLSGFSRRALRHRWLRIVAVSP